MIFWQVIERLGLTASNRQGIGRTSLLVLLVEPQTVGSHPERPGNHSPRRGVYAIRGAGNAECRGGLLYRTGIQKQRKFESANATAGVGHFVETSPGEQVMPTESAATDGGPPAVTAIGKNMAASANDQGW
jgi:hypothetical protein